MNKQTEYETLRTEILSSLQIFKNYRNILYTIVVAALVFAFNSNEAMLFLIPSFIIIPIYLLEMDEYDSIIRIATYIYVFLEPNTECYWETRLYKHEILKSRKNCKRRMSTEPYWYLSFGCLFLSLLKLNWSCMNFNFFLTIT